MIKFVHVFKVLFWSLCIIGGLKAQTQLIQGSFQSVEIDQNGNVWGGTAGSGLSFQINGAFSGDLTSHFVRDIEEGPDGKIWVASALSGATATSGGIRRYHSNTIGDYDFYSVLSAGLPTRYVNDIDIDANGYVFAAHGQHLNGTTTFEGAISVGEPSGNDYTWTTHTAGLPSTDRRVLRVTRRSEQLWAFVDRSCPGCQAPKVVAYDVSPDGELNYTGDITIPGITFTGATTTPRIESMFTDSREWTWSGFSREADLAVYNGTGWKVLNLGQLFGIDVSSLDLAVSKNSISEDTCGAVWVPTNYGLFRFTGTFEMLDSVNHWMLFDTSTVPDMPAQLINDIAFRDSVVIATFSGLYSFENDQCAETSATFLIKHKNIRPYGSNKIVTLKTISTSESNQFISVSADKVAASILDISSSDFSINQISVRLSHVSGSEEHRIGKIAHTELTGDTLRITYQHPDWMYNNKKKDTVLLEIVDMSNVALGALSIVVYRPPLVMIHGIWANIESFENMQEAFVSQGLYDHFQIQVADYSGTNAAHFATNAGVAPKNLQYAFIDYLNRDISVGAADIVCHSMGGILTRLYIQSSGFNTNIHKFITLNTPHSGSQCGDLIFDENINENVRNAICHAIQKMGFGSCNTGAVEDLGTQSDAIRDLNIGMTTRSISIHHVATTESIAGLTSTARLILRPAWWISLPILILDLTLTDLFNSPQHDMVVALNSQIGGLTNPAHNTVFTNQWHIGSAANQQVIAQVKYLLGITTPSQEFAEYNFMPPTLTYDTPILPNSLQSASRVENRNIGFVEIDDADFEDEHFGLSDTFTLTTNGSANVAAIVLLISDTESTVWRKEFEGNAGSILIETDSLNSGLKSVVAFGWDTINNTVYIDSSHFFIDFDTVPDSIKIIPEVVYMTQGETTFLRVRGYINNRIYDLSEDTLLQLHLEGDLLMPGDDPAEIIGNMIGIDSLYATYLSKTSNHTVIHVIAPPPDGSACDDAIQLFTTGTEPVKQINVGNGCHNCSDDAVHARWYQFTPPSYGVVQLTSCSSEVDTRLWVYAGACDSLEFIGGSVDACEAMPSGYMLGSQLVNMIVLPGTSYFFEWDDANTDSAFSFVFDFRSLCPDSTIMFVDSSGVPFKSGTSWTQAKGSLGEAISACTWCPGVDEFWIKKGTYYPDSNDRNVSFIFPDDLSVYGGFAGTEGSIEERQFLANVTVFSGNIGVDHDSLDNSFHVVRLQEGNENVRIDGVVIEDGVANGAETEDQYGAGILNYGQLSLVNSLIRNCSSSSDGAALFITGPIAAATLSEVQIINSGSPGKTIVNSNGATLTILDNTVIH